MKSRIERRTDYLTAMKMVHNCQDEFWAEIFIAANNFNTLRSLNKIFCLLESENMLDEAMDLFYLLCLGYEITAADFPTIFNTPGIKYPFINEFILEGEEVIEYLEREIFGLDDSDE